MLVEQARREAGGQQIAQMVGQRGVRLTARSSIMSIREIEVKCGGNNTTNTW